MTGFPFRISFDEATTIIKSVADHRLLEIESLALGRVHGRVLASDMIAPISLPPFDNSAMDGFAVRHADLMQEFGNSLQLVGEQFAGSDCDHVVAAGQCLRITTGAPLPAGTDTVVIKEDARLDGAHVVVPQVAWGANVRRGGEDVQVGDRVVAAGSVLTPARVSLAASLGFPSLAVRRKPTVAVFTTGDELVEPGMQLEPGQIYDSNRELLMGLLRADGLEPTAWPRLPDDPRQVEVALRDAGCAFDIIITGGAVSAGEKDHVPAVLEEFGTTRFWKVRMKPGMPVLFGTLDQAVFLGLPGNPVSVLATYLTLGRTLLDGLQGRSEPRPRQYARLLGSIDKQHERREFIRGRLTSRSDGSLLVDASPVTGSHRLRAAADADVLLVIPEGPQRLAAGAVVEVVSCR